MTATPLTLLVPQAFDKACDRLQEAQQTYTDAANDLVSAKCSLEFRRAEALCEGVEGKNAEAREAALRLSLFDEYAELAGREAALNEARGDLEQAKTAWDCLRYKLRLLEVQKNLEGAA